MYLRVFGVSLFLLGAVSGSIIPRENEDEVLPAGFCDEVRWDSNSTDIQVISCIERFQATSDISSQPAVGESCSTSEHQTNGTSSDDIAHSLGTRSIPSKNDAMDKDRYACDKKDLPYRSQMLPTSDGNHKRWCFRQGATPTYKDVAKICEKAGKSFDSTINMQRLFQIQRTKWATKIVEEKNKGTCFCAMLRHGTAGLKMCNCDRCDALPLNFGVESMCLSLAQGCTAKGYASGYLRTKYPNALYVLYGHKDIYGPLEEQVELDPVLEVDGVMTGSCNSGDENRLNQDYTGTVMACQMNSWYSMGCKPVYGKSSWWTFWRNFNPQR